MEEQNQSEQQTQGVGQDQQTTQENSQSGNFQAPSTEQNQGISDVANSTGGISDPNVGKLNEDASEQLKATQAPTQNPSTTQPVAPIQQPEQKEKAPTVRLATPGRTVVFFPGKYDTIAREDENESIPAIVVKTLDNNQVNLRAFTSGDYVPIYKNVPHKSDANFSDENNQYWDWPEIK